MEGAIAITPEALGVVVAILGAMVVAISVMFWQLVGALKARAERAEREVDTLIPAVERLTETINTAIIRRTT